MHSQTKLHDVDYFSFFPMAVVTLEDDSFEYYELKALFGFCHDACSNLPCR